MKIQNEYLQACFNSKGAELTSLKSKTTGIEYIWQADPKHWGRHTPVLFPFVGKLKDNSYNYQGKTYPMGQHGFARDMDFEVEKIEDDSISFLLKSNEETLAKYPFRFELRIQYHLSGKSLSTTYQVLNTSTEQVMYFSIGGHPAFNSFLDEQGNRSPFSLVFSGQESAPAHLLEDGLFKGKTEPSIMKGILEINKHSFDQDALVFKKLKSSSVEIHNGSGSFLTFKFAGFPYLGIWSKNQESPFVCIEPWYGLADHQNHNGNIEEKEGIQKLTPFSTFSCTYQIVTYS